MKDWLPSGLLERMNICRWTSGQVARGADGIDALRRGIFHVEARAVRRETVDGEGYITEGLESTICNNELIFRNYSCVYIVAKGESRDGIEIGYLPDQMESPFCIRQILKA